MAEELISFNDYLVYQLDWLFEWDKPKDGASVWLKDLVNLGQANYVTFTYNESMNHMRGYVQFTKEHSLKQCQALNPKMDWKYQFILREDAKESWTKPLNEETLAIEHGILKHYIDPDKVVSPYSFVNPQSREDQEDELFQLNSVKATVATYSAKRKG